MFTHNNRYIRRIFNFRWTKYIYEMNHMDRWIVPVENETWCRLLMGGSGWTRGRGFRSSLVTRRGTSVPHGVQKETEHGRAKAYARGEVRTHAGLTANRVRAPRAPPRSRPRPAPARHLTIDALYCINYLGNTQ